MRLLRFLALVFVTYVFLVAAYVGTAAIVGFCTAAPAGNALSVFVRILADTALSLARDSCAWIVGPGGAFSFVPTAGVLSLTLGLRSLWFHGAVNVVFFAVLGNFALNRGFSFGSTLLLPPLLVGLTVSLLKARLVSVGQVDLVELAAIVGLQVTGLFIGSALNSARPR